MFIRILKNFVLLFTVFMFIYGPVILSISNFFDISFFVSIGLIIYSLIKRRTIFPYYVSYFMPLIVLFLYCMFLVSFTDEYTLSIIFRLFLKPFRIIIVIMGGVALAKIFVDRGVKTFSVDSLYYIFISITLNGIIMILQFIYPEFKDWIYSFTISKEFRSTFDYNFRMGGLTRSSGGAVLSVVQSLGVLIAPFIWGKINNYRKIILICGSLLICSSVLICGRSGLWVIVLGFPISISLANELANFTNIIKKYVTISLFFTLFIFMLNYYTSMNSDSSIYLSLGRTLDYFVDSNQDGSFANSTIETLKNHILFPADIKTFLMGDGEHLLGKQFDRILPSDIGYVRNLWSFGIFGLFIYIFPLLTLIRFILKNNFAISISKSIILFIIIMFLFHSKELFLYVRMYFSIISLMVGVAYMEKQFFNRHNN
jgi:hypothetical protein